MGQDQAEMMGCQGSPVCRFWKGDGSRQYWAGGCEGEISRGYRYRVGNDLGDDDLVFVREVTMNK